ncbi:MAG: glycosyl transferase, partial [Anaerolineae bacterium]|nr:glycosyl transferase [Anaerolineae bacterium]
LLLGIVGMVTAWRSKLEIGPLLAVCVMITIAYVVFHPSTRYRAPADPFVFILAAVAWVRLWPILVTWLRPPHSAA